VFIPVTVLLLIFLDIIDDNLNLFNLSINLNKCLLIFFPVSKYIVVHWYINLIYIYLLYIVIFLNYKIIYVVHILAHNTANHWDLVLH
jgi:hypothetical protein